MLVYRFPNCMANGANLIIIVQSLLFAIILLMIYLLPSNDPSVELELLYIDDLVEEMILALKVRSIIVSLKD